MRDKIILLLASSPGLTGREIAKHIGEAKKDVNSFLYHDSSGLFIHKEYRWFLTEGYSQQTVSEPDPWGEIFLQSDSKLHNALSFYQKKGYEVPELRFYLQNDFGELIAMLDLAWPENKFCIVVDQDNKIEANKAGWHAISYDEIL